MAEHLTVDQVVVGSTPIRHPTRYGRFQEESPLLIYLRSARESAVLGSGICEVFQADLLFCHATAPLSPGVREVSYRNQASIYCLHWFPLCPLTLTLDSWITDIDVYARAGLSLSYRR
jgi:hypothetical protein